jgi:hypothetical protein
MKFLNRLIQTSLFIASMVFLYVQLFRNQDISRLLRILDVTSYHPGIRWYLLTVMLLMPLNWILEAVKWRFLISSIENTSLFRAIRAVLTGITISMFTPNRTGEYFGRVFLLRKANPVDGILITIVGSMAQLLITVAAGSVALPFFLRTCSPSFVIQHHFLFLAMISLILFINFISFGLFFNISLIRPARQRFRRGMPARVRHYFRVFSFYHRRELILILLLSAARYLIFSTQFFLLLKVFGLPLSYITGLMLIALIYLVMTLVPTIALTELGIRSSAAIYFISLWLEKTNPGADQVNTGVFAASLLLWVINLAIPALTGSAFIFHLRFFRKTTSSPV